MYLKHSARTVEEVFSDIEAAAKAEGFGVLHHYDFQQILDGKGFPIDKECRVLEVCNPRQASEVLAADMALNLALPCRLSVYEDGNGKTVVGMIPPTQMLALISNDALVAGAAASVELAMERIIEAVV